MITKYEQSLESLKELISRFKSIDISKLNEADTRFYFIDFLLKKVFNWDVEDVNCEESYEGNFTDYTLKLFRKVAVVEAKRAGNHFTVPIKHDKCFISLKTLCRDNHDLKNALQQVSRYCHERGIEIGIVCNGWQLVAFVANRSDSVAPLEGNSLIFNSLDFLDKHFLEIYNVLSKDAFFTAELSKKLIGNNLDILPPKKSSKIIDYPGIKNRNPLQVDLEIISDLVLEDIIKDKEIEVDFLEDCYCKSGSLSQYSLLSKQILTTRYDNMFEANDQDVLLESISTKKGVNKEFIDIFSDSLSKRPILLVGDVGVGKSTFIDNLLLVEAPEVSEKSLVFKIDLGSKAILAKEMKDAVLKIIYEQLSSVFNIDIYEDDFVRRCYFVGLENYKNSFSVKRLYEIDPKAAIKKEIEYLATEVDDLRNHIKNSLKYIAKNQRKQIIIFIDNCDQRDDTDQQQSFLIAQELASDWNLITFVSLRPETYHKTKRKEGALSGYHPKAFTISPPRIEDVITSRLHFAQKITRGEIKLTKLSNAVNFTKLDIMIETFLNSIEKNNELLIMFENLSNGNIRKVIELIKKFFGSGHVDTQKIIEINERGGNYIIPVHEMLRSIIYGDNVYYNPKTSDVINLFDIRFNSSKDHFLLSHCLGILNHQSKNNLNDGFLNIAEFYDSLQSLSYSINQIDAAINIMYTRGLIETSEKGNYLNTDQTTINIRITGAGAYHYNYLSNAFAYIDAVIIDTPIFTAEIFSELDFNSDLNSRLSKTRLFLEYLSDCWKYHNFNPSYFNWEENRMLLESDIQRISNYAS